MILSEVEILKTAKAVPAIYKITNIVNGRVYVGSTKNYRERRTRHFYELRHNTHCNQRLQNAFNKYGEDNFKIEMLTPVTPDEMLWMEQNFIDWLDSANRNVGYNICKIAGRPVHSGWHHSEESKRRLSRANTGKQRTLEARANMSIAQKRLFASGYIHPNKGKVFSGEEKEKHRIAMAQRRKAVIRIDKDGLERQFVSLGDAERNTPKANAWCISRCCRGLARTAGGYTWRWVR